MKRNVIETPFTFGRIASDNNFANRESEILKLVTNFISGINTVLISPRRWGKSSLVKKSAENVSKKNKDIRFVFIDLYNIRNEEEFYKIFSREVLRSSTKKTDELLANAKKFMGKLIPQLTFSTDPNSEINISFDWETVKKEPDDILDLPENISKQKNIKFIICIDEFQNISAFDDALSIQKKLRSHWQKHKLTSYCLYGSKRHMLMDVFTSPSMPFYKFGDIIFLQKIEKKHLEKFIIKRFKDTKKNISKSAADLVVDIAECHPYYVQQLAQLSWLRTKKSCNEEIVKIAHESLILQLDFLFQSISDDLSSTQLNFLKAVIIGIEQLSSKQTLDEFNLGTSANVLRIKKSLENKEIIDLFGNTITILDPMYKYWLKNYYFKI